MRIQLLDEPENDLQDGREFYNRQEPGVGDYFAAALASDIDSLILFAGIHPMAFGFIAHCRNAFSSEFTISWKTRLFAAMPCSIYGVIPPGFAVG